VEGARLCMMGVVQLCRKQTARDSSMIHRSASRPPGRHGSPLARRRAAAAPPPPPLPPAFMARKRSSSDPPAMNSLRMRSGPLPTVQAPRNSTCARGPQGFRRGGCGGAGEGGGADQVGVAEVADDGDFVDLQGRNEGSEWDAGRRARCESGRAQWLGCSRSEGNQKDEGIAEVTMSWYATEVWESWESSFAAQSSPRHLHLYTTPPSPSPIFMVSCI
jgi:hypothetical protein